MVFLVRIGHPRYAHAFADHLKSLGVVATLEPQAEGVALYLQDEAMLDLAHRELEQFKADPNNPRYRQASWLLEGDSEDLDKAKHLSGLYKSNAFAKAVKATGPFTKLVIVFCSLVFLWTAQGADIEARAPFMFFETVTAMTSSLELWRWIGPAFIHFGIFHFAFNMTSWWIFGGLVERAQTSTRLIVLLMFCGVISNATQFLWSGNRFGGLSGVVYGVLGYLWFYSRFNPAAGIRIPPGLIVLMLITLAIGFTNILPFANQAHLSGLLSGCFLGGLFAKLDRMPRQ